jgi:hypothetical protein
MKTLDRAFAWIILLLGCTHCIVTFVVHKSLAMEAIWFFSGGLAMIFGALLNLVRIARPDDKLAARVSALANLLLFGSLWSPRPGCCAVSSSRIRRSSWSRLRLPGSLLFH